MTTWRCLATVIRVIDGDTFAADFDLGWGVYMHEVKGRPNRVRILGVDTPERTDLRYIEARDFLASILTPQVWVTSEKLDSFGRTLASVTTTTGEDIASMYPPEWRLLT